MIFNSNVINRYYLRVPKDLERSRVQTVFLNITKTETCLALSFVCLPVYFYPLISISSLISRQAGKINFHFKEVTG